MSEPRYVLAARLLHWLMAAGFVFMWACGYVMTTWAGEDTPLEELLFDLHISIGVTLAALLVLRIAIRLTHRPPPLPERISGLERHGAHVGHAALYAVPAMVICAGWAETNLGDHTVKWFGAGLPKVFPTVEAGGDFAQDAHMWLACSMLIMAGGHALAALKHRYLDGHDVIERMTFGRKR